MKRKVILLAIVALAVIASASWWIKSRRVIKRAATPPPAASQPVLRRPRVRPHAPGTEESVRTVNAPARGALADSLRRDRDLQEDGFGCAQRGIDAVLARLGELDDARQRESFLRGVFRQAAASGVDAALDWAGRMPPGDTRETALLTLLGEWSGRSVAAIVSEGGVQQLGVGGALGLFLLDDGRATPERVAALANEFLRGTARTELLAEAAVRLAGSDPAKAFALGEGLAGGQQLRFLSRFAAGWASTDAQAAWQWVGEVAADDARARLQASVIEAEAAHDPASAVRHFLQITPLQGARSEAAERLAEQWAATDTAAALQWVETLPSAADRAAAQRGIERSAPVGIGAVIGVGSDGEAVINDLLPDGAARQAGALAKGDRILAVSYSEGQWVDAHGMALGDLVGLIRGKPNTAVSLRVQPAGAAAPRTVTIGRLQIVHRLK